MTKQNDKPEPLMSIKEVAASMKTSEKTVHRKIASGELPVVRIGRLKRIRPEDYRHFLLSNLKT